MSMQWHNLELSFAAEPETVPRVRHQMCRIGPPRYDHHKKAYTEQGLSIVAAEIQEAGMMHTYTLF
jgi:hypothetical protein